MLAVHLGLPEIPVENLEKLAKFNPYHDELGRFTTADGAVSPKGNDQSGGGHSGSGSGYPNSHRESDLAAALTSGLGQASGGLDPASGASTPPTPGTQVADSGAIMSDAASGAAASNAVPAGMESMMVTAPHEANSLRRAKRVVLRGLGATYLDSEFAAMVENFDRYSQDGGVTLKFVSGYRSPAAQQALRDSGQGITPAELSLHSAGLAVDVNYNQMNSAEQGVVRRAAARAGLSWGGQFRTPDRVHFYHDPGGDRQALIDNSTHAIQRINNNEQR